MTVRFDGRKIRDQILSELKVKLADLPVKPSLAVIWIGDDPVSARYVEQKQRAAEFLGVHFDIIKFPESASEASILEKIYQLSNDDKIDGLMVQLPVPANFNREKLINSISAEKDVDGLRFCQKLNCKFRPPVILSIMEAIKASGVDHRGKKVAIIGKGFLVGSPLAKHLQGDTDLRVADENTSHLGTLTTDADIIISAVGKSGLIKPNMIKNDAVLIDAGTTELGGKLRGDIDSAAYEKASFYTPVPGGIGPVTVVMLFRNLIQKL
ncbi:MAG: bifunctional 5,10-methylenetetrahydrofolate dehydrogenase/5,10-methenyltetrahydrofolate cyclohydrolase [Candidatus Berkelbacteria bacterium]